jgi:N-glycosylase/DNA lyase
MHENLTEMRLDLGKTPLNLDHTLSCGQVFRWQKKADWWQGVVRNNYIQLRQKGSLLQLKSEAEDVDVSFFRSYFRLDDDLLDIYRKISKDRFVKDAVKRFYGLRLMRQEPWECLISYICATNKNIPAIKNMIANLCKHFGKKITLEQGEFNTFPTPRSLAEASLRELRLCKLGFRAERVKDAAQLVSKGIFSLGDVKNSPYEEAKKRLMNLPGIGPKVADCILLFAFGKLEAFPIDVWMKRLILEFYADHFEPTFVKKARRSKSPSPREYKAISLFGRQYFGEYVGYAQEYLYHFRRCMP